MAKQITVCPVSEMPPGTVTGAGPYAVGNIDGNYFAVTRRCRHLRADLAGGSIEDGRLVCPWHQSAYDVENGQMVRGPQQIFAKIPGLGTTFKMLTKVWPLQLKILEQGIGKTGQVWIRSPDESHPMLGRSCNHQSKQSNSPFVKI